MPLSPRARLALVGILLLLPVAPLGADEIPGGSPKIPSGPYLYEDANGSTRMVKTLEEVPPAFRERARTLGGARIEYQGRVTTMTPERAQRARERTRQMATTPERRRDPVVFYSASWCGYCNRVRDYLRKKGIAYEERSIDDPVFRAELKRETGAGFVPVVVYGGERVVGWNPAGIDALGL